MEQTVEKETQPVKWRRPWPRWRREPARPEAAFAPGGAATSTPEVDPGEGLQQRAHRLWMEAQAISEMGLGLHGLVSQLRQDTADEGAAAEALSQAAAHLTALANDVAGGSEHQTQALEALAESLRSVGVRVGRDREGVTAVTRQGEQAMAEVERGKQASRAAALAAEEAASVLQHLEDAVAGLAQRLQEVATLTATISRFADQTNLLALNAAIEAARAGKDGRGFAVVAAEVRRLADSSSQAARQADRVLADLGQEMAKVAETAQAGKRRADAARTAAQAASRALEEAGSAMVTTVRALAGAEGQLRETAETFAQTLDALSEVAAVASQHKESAHRLDQAARRLLDHSGQIGICHDHHQVLAKTAGGVVEQLGQTSQRLQQEAEEILVAAIGLSLERPDQSGELLWDPNYSVHVPTMDAQHRQIVDWINRTARATPAELPEILAGLEAYTATHFADEEAVMRRIGFPELEAHQVLHQRLIAWVAEQKARGADRQTLLFGLAQWLVKHILGQDKRYGRWAERENRAAT